MKFSLLPTLGHTLSEWSRGVRLYISLASLLISLEVWWWAATTYSGSVLYATRLEEAYAWLSLSLLALALLIGPLYSVFRQLPAGAIWRDARRLIGVSAAWFASLHVTIAYVSLFHFANPFQLPRSYQDSFLYGLLALLVLLAMAFTSFDLAFRRLGIWWHRLHRLVYAAALLSLFHAFLIGTHTAQWPLLIALTSVAVVILGLHVYLAFVRRDRPTIWQLLAISSAILLLIAVFNFGYGQKLGYNPIEGKKGHHHAP